MRTKRWYRQFPSCAGSPIAPSIQASLSSPRSFLPGFHTRTHLDPAIQNNHHAPSHFHTYIPAPADVPLQSDRICSPSYSEQRYHLIGRAARITFATRTVCPPAPKPCAAPLDRPGRLPAPSSGSADVIHTLDSLSLTRSISGKIDVCRRPPAPAAATRCWSRCVPVVMRRLASRS